MQPPAENTAESGESSSQSSHDLNHSAGLIHEDAKERKNFVPMPSSKESGPLILRRRATLSKEQI